MQSLVARTERPRRTNLQAFESLYDPATGLWHVPGWMHEPFDHSKMEDYQQLPLHPSPVEREVADIFRALIRLTKPRRILETGTNLGYSAYAMAAALLELGGDRSLVTIDVQAGRFVFEGTEVAPLITFLLGSSLDVDLSVLGPERLDMLVLDSDHTYGTISGEVNRFAPLLRVGGLMLFHDTMYFDGIALVVKQLQQHPAFEVVNLDTPRQHSHVARSPGMTIVRKVQQVSGDIIDRSDADMLSIEVNAPGRGDRDRPLV